MSSEKLQSAFQKFGELLDTRFSKNVYTKEDAIRYTFFHAICSELGLGPEDIILEYPHPYILDEKTKEKKKKIDMLIPERDGVTEIICEFKFHGGIPSGQATNITERAGDLFADICRLAIYKKK